MEELTRERILEKGYKEFRPTEFHHDIDKCYQKRFDDEIGKKYFIDIHEYAPFTDRDGRTWPRSYEFVVYLYKKSEDEDKDYPVKMLFFVDWTLDMVEEHVEALFATGMYRHYERWDEC